MTTGPGSGELLGGMGKDEKVAPLSLPQVPL